MPAATEAPAVTLSFANNFWGKDDSGVSRLLDRMQGAKVTSDELKNFYSTRAAIEEEYARKLLALAKKPLGAAESGTLRMSVDVVRAETEAVGKAHSNIAGQMRSELDEPLAAFAGGMKERRKIVQGGIEKLLKLKMQQTTTANKARDRYEQDCLKIKGYLAQGHMVMGQEERKNKAKLEKTQVQLSSTSNEYEAAIKALEETTGRWNRDWKAACDKFQDLEEERIDFTKSSLWTFANIASTVCVSDDASCEKIRLSLEDCDVEKDICTFIKENSTGQEIPDPPKFIDFCRGDINDNASEASDEGAYKVAQFPRPINPAIRSSSPQPSMLESHHDPSSVAREIARDMGIHTNNPPAQDPLSASDSEMHQYRSGHNPYQNKQFSVSGVNVPAIPHDPYPQDGMTQFCRTAPSSLGPPSAQSSVVSPVRPSSRDSQSECSNPTSLSSFGPSSGHQSPVKQYVEEEPAPKKKGGFFNSPFRRRSRHEKEHNQQTPPAKPAGRNTWAPSTARKTGKENATHSKQFSRDAIFGNGQQSASPEPADPRENYQLNVGGNVFDVAPSESRKLRHTQPAPGEEVDPIAQALEELRGVTKGTQHRVSADRYAGMATPGPGTPNVHSPLPGGQPTPLINATMAGAQRGTPPPSYDQPPMSRLGAPPAAHTSRAMKETTSRYVHQRQSVYQSSPNRPSSRAGPVDDVVRSTSPAPVRSASPRPGYESQSVRHQPQQGYRPASQADYRAPSPSPYSSNRARANTTTPQKVPVGYGAPTGYFGHGGSPNGNVPRAVSPQPGYLAQSRPGSRGGAPITMQASSPAGTDYGGSVRGRTAGVRRPTSQYMSGTGSDVGPGTYGPGGGQVSTRVRSKSQADPRQFSKDGRPILHYARAMYMYQAQIPEELGFGKGDVLAVLRLQDDGWWEAETVGKQPSRGLVPSNYLQAC